MITALGADVDGYPLVLCGLTPENLERLKAGQPVRVSAGRLESMGMVRPVTIIIAYAEDQATLLGELEGALVAGGKSS